MDIGGFCEEELVRFGCLWRVTVVTPTRSSLALVLCHRHQERDSKHLSKMQPGSSHLTSELMNCFHCECKVTACLELFFLIVSLKKIQSKSSPLSQ